MPFGLFYKKRIRFPKQCPSTVVKLTRCVVSVLGVYSLYAEAKNLQRTQIRAKIAIYGWKSN